MIFNDKRIHDNELLIFAQDLDVTTVCIFLLFLPLWLLFLHGILGEV